MSKTDPPALVRLSEGLGVWFRSEEDYASDREASEDGR